VTVDAEHARAEAARADQVTAQGVELGPLHGLPITVKDAIEVAGLRSTGGATALAEHVPDTDAPAVAQLRAAGAVVFGKTNVPEWSGDIQAYNQIFGTTNNPWDISRTTGGSSGGAAAAVAAGLTSFELGTDIGGSVRIPSNYCGVCGHKPSFGVVSQRGYLDRVGGGSTDSDINVFGPLARHPADLDLVLEVLAGPNREDATAWKLRLPEPRHRSLPGYRIGLWLDDPACRVDTEVLDRLSDAASALAGAGVEVVDSHPPVDFAHAYQLFNSLILAAVSVSVDRPVGDAISGTHRAWLDLDVERSRLRRQWADWFRDFDVLMCPVMPMPAFPHDHEGTIADRFVTINGERRNHVETLGWTGLIGVVYLPSTVVPVGRTSTGLPVGAQLVGPYLEDRTPLFVAKGLVDLVGGYQPPPLA
jgi:amidase